MNKLIKITKKQKIDSGNSAILISAGAFSVVLPIPGIMVAVLLFTIMIFVANSNKLSHSVMPLIGFCIIFFIGSFIFVEDRSGALFEYFIKFIFMGFTGLFISQSRFVIELVVKYTCYLSIVLLPFFLRTNIASSEDWGIMMGISYYVIVFLNALIYQLFILPQRSKIEICSFSIILIIYTLFFLAFASRGAILSVAFFVFLCIIIKSGKKRIPFLVISSFFITIISIFFFEILQFISDFAASYGFSVLAINKMLYFMDGELANGRDTLTSMGVEMFWNSPILGNGIASFENKYCEGYVHNLFLQMLIEGGVILIIPFILLILNSFKIIFNDSLPLNERYFMAFLISISLIHLFFSETFWRLQYFWFYIGYTIRLSKNNHQSKSLI